MAAKHGNRKLNQMTAAAFRKLVRLPGLHTDGGGLYMRVGTDGNSASWLYVFQFAGRRREMGLGSARLITLALARERAAAAREQVAKGIDPIDSKRAPQAIPSFGELADQWIEAKKGKVKSKLSIARWKRALGPDGYAKALRAKRVDTITNADVLAVIKPVANRLTTARTMRSYVAAVFDLRNPSTSGLAIIPPS